MNSAVRNFARATIVLVAVIAAACGGSSGSGSVLGDAVGRIGQIRAGDLSVRFTMAPKTRPSSNTVGLAMQGSFALDQRLPLPVLNIAYTRLAGTQSRS